MEQQEDVQSNSDQLQEALSQRSQKSSKRRSNTLNISQQNMEDSKCSSYESRDGGSSNPPRVIEINTAYKENPAKHKLKMEYMSKYRELLGMSTLITKPRDPKDIRVRSQDVKTILQATDRIEKAHKRLNQKVEDILLCNKMFYNSKIQLIQDSDDKIFYKVNKQNRANDQNILINNPVFNTLYDDIMVTRQKTQDAVRQINELHPNNPFRNRYIDAITQDKDCPQKIKEKLFEPLQYVMNNQSDNILKQESSSVEISFPQIELIRDTNINRKTLPSGKFFFQTQCQHANQKQSISRPRTQSFTLDQTSKQDMSFLNDKVEPNNISLNPQTFTSINNSKNKSMNNTFRDIKSEPFKTSPKVIQQNPILKQTFKENLKVYSQLEESKRDQKLYYYQTQQEVNELKKILPSNNCKNDESSYNKQVNIHLSEKLNGKYQSYKSRMPRLKFNPYAIKNNNENRICLNPSKNDDELNF